MSFWLFSCILCPTNVVKMLYLQINKPVNENPSDIKRFYIFGVKETGIVSSNSVS